MKANKHDAVTIYTFFVGRSEHAAEAIPMHAITFFFVESIAQCL